MPMNHGASGREKKGGSCLEQTIQSDVVTAAVGVACIVYLASKPSRYHVGDCLLVNIPGESHVIQIVGLDSRSCSLKFVTEWVGHHMAGEILDYGGPCDDFRTRANKVECSLVAPK